MDTLQTLSAGIVDSLRPLGFAAGADDSVIALVEDLGWTLPSVPPSLSSAADAMFELVASLEAIRTAIVAAEFGEGPADEAERLAGELVLDLLVAAEALHGLPAELAAELPPAFVAASGIENEFETRLFDRLISNYLARRHASLHQTLKLFGIVELTQEPEDPTRHQPAFERHRVRWNRIGPGLKDPAGLFADIYGWGRPDFDVQKLFERLVPLSFAIGMPARLRYPAPTLLQNVAPQAGTEPPERQLHLPIYEGETVSLVLALFAPPQAAGPRPLAIALKAGGLAREELALEAGFALKLEASGGLGTGAGLLLTPGEPPKLLADIEGAGGNVANGRIGAWIVNRPPAYAAPPGGGAAGSRFSFEAMSLGLVAEAATGMDADVRLELKIDKAKLVIAAPEGDGLLNRILPEDGLTAAFSLAIGWSRSGLHFSGTAGLELAIPLDLALGPIRLREIQVKAEPGDDGLAAAISASASARIGPVEVTVQRMGLSGALRFSPGNLGPIDFDLGFKWPSGAGLSIDAGPIKGAGIIDFDAAAHRYFGAFELQANTIGINAVAVLNTQLPGGLPGYSLLITLRASFPAIQLGYGFALTAVGGLIAPNRRIDVDALRQRLATGTAGRILAPTNPVGDTSLLSDLEAVFPSESGVVVLGPTAQVTWAGFVAFDIGIFLEFPGPSKIVLLGSVRAAIAAEDRIYLMLRADVVGVVDLQQKLAAFDAVLINSQLLEVLELTGGAAFRLSWGDQPYAVLTVGGFHPAYNPEPMTLPASLTRIAMVYGAREERLYLRLEGYFAVTTNTLQFGAAIEAVIRAGDFNIQGMLAFDALIEREPFHFEVDLRASVRVRYKSRNLAGLTLTGKLSGPGPVTLRAKVCIELLFFDICFSDTFRIGSSVPPPARIAGDPFKLILAELDRPGALVATGGDVFVQLRPSETDVISPAARLLFVQHQAPLDMLLERVQGMPTPSPISITIAGPPGSETELDWFAPGAFANLSHDEALTRRAFERLQAGLRLGGGAARRGPASQRTLSVHQIRLPQRNRTLRGAEAFPAWLLERSAGAPSQMPPPEPAIRVAEEQWSLVHPTGVVLEGMSSTAAHQFALLAPKQAKTIAVAHSERLPDLVF